MANVDGLFGFKPVGMLNGADLPPIRMAEHTTGTAVFRYDLLKASSGNLVSCDDVSDVPIAISMEYVAASVATSTEFGIIPLIPGLILKVQVDDGTLTDTSTNWTLLDFVIGSGDTTTGFSAMELDGNASVRDSFMLLGLSDDPDNAWGSNCNVLVTPMVTAMSTNRAITA